MELELRDLTFCTKDGKHITVNLEEMRVTSDSEPDACTNPTLRQKALLKAGYYYGIIVKSEEEFLAE